MAESKQLEAVNPDDLLSRVRSRSFLWIVAASLVVHVIAIVGTSIGYMGLMRQFRSWHPRIEMKRQVKEKREQDDEARRKAARDKLLAEQAKASAPKGDEKGLDEKASPKATTATKAGGEKAPILKELEKKSSERPKDSSLKMNELDQP